MPLNASVQEWLEGLRTCTCMCDDKNGAFSNIILLAEVHWLSIDE